MKLLLLFCLLPLISLGQLKWSFDNTLTGVYGTTKTGNQLTLTMGGLNSIDYKKFGFDIILLHLPFLDWILYDRLSVVDTLLPTTPNDKSDVDKTSFEKST